MCFLCGFWLEDQEGGGSEKSGQSGKWKWFGLQKDGDVRYHHVEYPTLFFALTQSEAALYEQRPKGLSAEQDKQRKRVRDKLQDAYNKHKVVVGASAGKAATSACSSQKTAGCDEMTTPTTTTKRSRPPGRSPTGKRWNGSEWEDCEKAATRHAARDARNKAKREKQGQRGPGRPSLPPREPKAEANGKAADMPIKEQSRAVLSSFMREQEAIPTRLPEQSVHAVVQREEPNDVSAQQVRFASRLLAMPSARGPHALLTRLRATLGLADQAS